MSLPFDILASHSGKTTHRQWLDNGYWLYPGDSLALVTAEAGKALEADAQDAKRFRALDGKDTIGLIRIAFEITGLKIPGIDKLTLAGLADILIDLQSTPKPT